MTTTPFQDEWRNDAARWGLSVKIPHIIEIAGHSVVVPVLLRDFGAVRGMLLVTDFSLIDSYQEQLVADGYGYSCLSEPSEGDRHPEADEAFMSMLSDWGWTGESDPPTWYREYTS